MNCYTHGRSAAVGVCGFCQRAVCHECVARDAPRVVCAGCAGRSSVMAYGWGGWYGYGFEYKSSAAIGGLPLVHVCSGVDPVTMRPRIAVGVIAIGNVAVGGVAMGGVACGLVAVGGVSLGLLLAVGGVALGLGLSIGGIAVGSIAIGGVAAGFFYALGGDTLGFRGR
jgi:hypothetical protein